MVVCLNDERQLSQILSLERPGVQLYFDETTYRLMFEALDRVMNAKEGRLAHLRDIFHGSLRPQFAAGGSMPLSLPWLNAAQEAAVGEALKARDVMVVHGPPGTGKTTTLIEAVCETLRREPQVLVCAQSNTAVDWISEQLANRGLGVLRIGNPTRVTDAMLQNTYERRFEAHPDYPALWQTRRTIRQLYSQPRKGRPANFHQKIARLKERADELEIRIRHALFDGCRVVAATLAGTANPVHEGRTGGDADGTRGRNASRMCSTAHAAIPNERNTDALLLRLVLWWPIESGAGGEPSQHARRARLATGVGGHRRNAHPEKRSE